MQNDRLRPKSTACDNALKRNDNGLRTKPQAVPFILP